MAPLPSMRKSGKMKPSPRGFGIRGMVIRKPQPYGVRKPVYADRNQVDVLEKGLKILNEGGTGGSEAASGCERTEVTSRKAPMKVVVRVRPLNSRENATNAKEVIAVSGPNMITFDPERQQDEFFYRNQKLKDVTARKYKNQTFAFDHVYDSTGTNQTIYEDVMKPLLNTLLNGFNCSVFAYGATGSGKTYTMLGSPGNPGLTFLTINDLYQRLDAMQEDFETQVVISYFEVYNEQVMDLLNPTGKQLAIMEVGNGIEIRDLSFHHPLNICDLLDMLRRGNANRSQHPTDHNAESSRSHAVLQVHIKMRERHKGMSSSSKTSKLVMVDLAGSEKGCATGFSGQRFREGSSINKSLLALGKVMEALASGKKTFSFRDSKLTRILKDSLGGNCRTVMVANISPSESLYEDILSTLRYAQKAKKISCNASKNVITVQSCLSEYTRVVDEMTTKIQSLEQQLKESKDLSEQQMNEKDEVIKELERRLVVTEGHQRKEEEFEALQKVLKQTEEKLRLTQYEQKPDLWTLSKQFDPRVVMQKLVGEAGECSSSGKKVLPSPEEIEEVNGFQSYLDEEKFFGFTLLPKLEKNLRDFQLKLDQVKKLRCLASTTGDQRYEKAANKASGKLESIAKCVEISLQETLTNRRERYDLGVYMLSNSQVTECRISVNKLCEYNIDQARLEVELSETQALRQQLGNLTSQLTRKEDLLKEFAILSNQMYNSLNHYGNLAPTMKEQYDKLVSSYCSPSLKFAENSQFVESGVCKFFGNKAYALKAHTDNKKFSMLHYDRETEVSEYMDDVKKRLSRIKDHVEDLPAFQSRIDALLRTFDVDMSDIGSNIDDLSTEELDSLFSFDEMEMEPIVSAETLKDMEEVDPNVFLGDLNVTDTVDPDVRNDTSMYCTLKGSGTVAADTTVTLNKDLDNTFTLEQRLQDSEVNENHDPLIYPGTSGYTMPTSNESEFFHLKTAKDAAGEFSARAGAKSSKLSPKYETSMNGGGISYQNYISPGISPSEPASSTGLPRRRKIPILTTIPRSASPRRPYQAGVGACKPVLSAGKIPSATKLVVPKSPSVLSLVKAKKAALNKIRGRGPGNQQRQRMRQNLPQKSTWQRPPII